MSESYGRSIYLVDVCDQVEPKEHRHKPDINLPEKLLLLVLRKTLKEGIVLKRKAVWSDRLLLDDIFVEVHIGLFVTVVGL